MGNSSPVRQLPTNAVGKDYVVGDLHGCFSLLERLLLHVGFDSACDRLFSVGDLIDRGPDSLRCLQLLDEPWFYPVLGNHEIMMLHFFLPYMADGQLENIYDNAESMFLVNGGMWVKEHYRQDSQTMSAEFNRCLQLLSNVPLIWIVGENQNRFNVIHGELMRSDYKSAAQIVWLDSDIDGWLNGKEMPANTQERLSWGRSLMLDKAGARKRPAVQEGLSTTFCGHTLDKRPRQVLSHLCIDTGAFLSMDMDLDAAVATNYGLTLFDCHEARWFRATHGLSGIMMSSHILD